MKKILLLILLFTINVNASQITFSLENDTFAFGDHHSDDDYSNGARLEYLMDNKFGIAFGQSMYTPSDLTIKEDQPGERQYAGYLYLEGNYRRKPNEFGAIQLGFIGENSLSEQTQKIVHKWIGSKDPKGWDNQIKGHGIEAQAYYKYMYYLYKSEYFYLCPSATISGGTINAMITPGMFGYLCFNYVPSYQNGLPVTEIRGIDNHFTYLASWIPSAYLFIGAECDTVFYNYFLDAKESTVDKKWVVGEFSAGVGLKIKNLLMKFTYILKTKEYDEQKHNANFGVISIGWNW